MVAYLKKTEGSEGFHQIVDFLNASHIRYALTENPTIYVSPIQQFWQTATRSTLDNGEMGITATIDGKVKTVTEASIRRHLKLEDFDGISNFPTTEIFEQLALMGVDIPLFSTMLVQGPVVQGEGSTVLVESHHTPTGAPSTLQPHLSPTLRSFIRQETKVPQPSSPPHTNVADEAPSTGMDVRHGGAVTIILDTGHGSGNIDKTPSIPLDSPLLRGHTLGSDEGRLQHNELMDLVTKLSDRVGRKIAEIDQDPDISLVQHDTKFNFDFSAAKEVSTAEENVSTAEPVSTASAAVTTASVAISTATPTRVSTIDDIAAESLVYIRRSAAKTKDKGKGIMKESESTMTKKKRQQEQERLGLETTVRLQEEFDEKERQRIARVHKAASSFNIEEWEDIKARVEVDEELAQRLQAEEREKYTEAEQARLLVELINQRKRYFAKQRAEEMRNKPPTQAQKRSYMLNYIKNMGSYTLKQLRGYSFDEIKTLFETTMREVQTFVPIESEDDRAVPKLAAESSKRPAKEELDQQSSKKQKTREIVPELSQEELQQMMIIVPEQGMNVEALQTKYPIIDWEIYTEDTRKFWKIIRVGNHIEVYQFFDNMLKAFDRDDLVMLWSLVKEKFNSIEQTYDKDREIWVKLKRLFEPNTDDEL
ncbi:hypothetical protein Tco_0105134 [Tanacetum coccineum]